MPSRIVPFFKAVAIGLFLIGLLAVGVLGTETRMLFFWPGCLLLGLSAVCAVLRGQWRLVSTPSDVCFASALAFGSYIIVRGLMSPVAYYAREDIFIVLGCAVVYTLSATALSRPKARSFVLWVLLLVTIGNLAVGTIHFSGRWTFHLVPGFVRSFGDAHRIGGFYNNPNHLAAFLSMSALFFAGTVFFGRTKAPMKLLLAFVSLASALGIALTVSRGAMIGLAAGGAVLLVAAVMVLSQTHRHVIGRVLIGGGVLGIVGALVLYGLFSQQLESRFVNGGYTQGDPRAFIWRAALAQHTASPVIGAGSRMFYDGCVQYRSAGSPSWMKDALFAHNEWIQSLADYGWVGLALVLTLVFFHFLNAWCYLKWFVGEKFPHSASLSSGSLGFTVGATAALVATLIHAAFEFQFHVPATALSGAFLFGILANPGMENPINRPLRVRGVRPLMKLALFIAGITMISGSWTYGRADRLTAKAGLNRDEDDAAFVQRLSLWTEAIEIDPVNAETWHSRGLARLNAAAGRPVALANQLLKRAVTDLEEARRLNPFNHFMALALADAYDAVGKPDEAERCIRDAIRLAPMFRECRLSLAIHFHRLKRFPEAEDAYLSAWAAGAGQTEEWLPFYAQMLKDAVP